MESNKQFEGRNKTKATTGEVIGDGVLQIQIDPKWQWHYDTLQSLRTHLIKEQNELHEEANEEYTGPRRNDADVATNTFDRDWALGTLSAEQDALYEIDEAINRIRNGTYGKCEITGQPIEVARLKAVPWTRFSIQGEREAERRGVLVKLTPKLGRLESLPREHPPESYGKD